MAKQRSRETGLLAGQGSGCTINPDELTDQRLRDDVETVLTTPKFETAALALRDEIGALPDPANVLMRIDEMLARN